MSERIIDPARQGVSQEPEMEDKAITRARREGFWSALAAMGCAVAVVGILATAPASVGYWPADAALFLLGASLTAVAVFAPAFALTRHDK